MFVLHKTAAHKKICKKMGPIVKKDPNCLELRIAGSMKKI